MKQGSTKPRNKRLDACYVGSCHIIRVGDGTGVCCDHGWISFSLAGSRLVVWYCSDTCCFGYNGVPWQSVEVPTQYWYRVGDFDISNVGLFLFVPRMTEGSGGLQTRCFWFLIDVVDPSGPHYFQYTFLGWVTMWPRSFAVPVGTVRTLGGAVLGGETGTLLMWRKHTLTHTKHAHISFPTLASLGLDHHFLQP